MPITSKQIADQIAGKTNFVFTSTEGLNEHMCLYSQEGKYWLSNFGKEKPISEDQYNEITSKLTNEGKFNTDPATFRGLSYDQFFNKYWNKQ